MKLEEYKRKKQFLLCIDSDGCAMNTMEVKHREIFGPKLVSEWGLETWKDECLAIWNEINLDSSTRGIHRFLGLRMALEEINNRYTQIPDLKAFVQWTEEEKVLSNNTLLSAFNRNRSICLQKALNWSEQVNRQVEALRIEEKKPFGNVREILRQMHEYVEIAVISSANPEAVKEEWEYYGLLKYTDILCTQENGSKEYCINILKEKGYAGDCILMCGDALGDLRAAKQNQILFYPIIHGKEEECWKEFQKKGAWLFLKKMYAGSYQEEKIKEFKESF